MTQTEAFMELMRRADAGSQECRAGLKKLLDERPEIWQAAGDVAAVAERNWVGLLAAGSTLLEESIQRRLALMKQDLAGSQAGPLEKLLIDLLGVCWLATCQAETAAAQVGGSIPQATYKFRKAESAQRRFANAVRTLILVRTLLPRPVPVRAPTPAGRQT
jgi:hypothetical protein